MGTVQTQRMPKYGKWLLASLALLILIAAAIYSIHTPPAQPDFLANRTDAYEKILAVTKELNGDPRDATNNIAAYIEKNKAVFEKFAALSNERMEPPARFYIAAGIGTDFMDFKRFSQALLLKSKLAEEQHKWTEASDLCLQTIRYGQNVENGPLISFLVGTAIELFATKRLSEILPNLPKTNLITLATDLQRLNQSRPAFDSIIERERYYAAKNSTDILDLIIHQITFRKNDALKSTEERRHLTRANFEVLITTIAARLYTLEHQAAPKSLADLVPKYLPASPIDPFSNTPLILTNSATNAIIYSIGPNKRNDSAKADDIRPQCFLFFRPPFFCLNSPRPNAGHRPHRSYPSQFDYLTRFGGCGVRPARRSFAMPLSRMAPLFSPFNSAKSSSGYCL